MKLTTFYDHVTDIAAQENISVQEALRKTKEMGIDLLEVSNNNIAGREAELKAEFAAAGLRVSSLCAYFDFGKTGYVEEQAIHALESTLQMGAARMLVIPGFIGEDSTTEEREAQTDKMIAAIAELQKEAQKRNITLLLEDYDHHTAPFATIAGVQRFLDGIPQLMCAFDTGNFLYSGEDAEEAYALLKDRIGYVHLKDRNWKEMENGEKQLCAAPVGGGVIPMEKLFANLRADGYDGPYAIELYGSGESLEHIRKSVEWLRERD